MIISHGYGIIIDAGSSGSRIYLYRWPKRSNEHGNGGLDNGDLISTILVEQQAIFSDESNVAISNTEQNGIGMLDELLSSTKYALPSDANPVEIPIYLGATAGMRLSSFHPASHLVASVHQSIKPICFH